MSIYQSLAGLTAGVLSAICFVPYIISTLQGKTKPHRITWWVLSLIFFIFSINQFSVGGLSTIWLPLFQAIGQLILAILSVRYGEGRWKLFDGICVAGVCISLIAGKLLNSPILSLGFSISADFLGYLPTMQKASRAPETENLTCWSLLSVGSIFNLLAIGEWDSAQVVLPVYIFLTNIIIVFLLLKPYFKLWPTKTLAYQGIATQPLHHRYTYNPDAARYAARYASLIRPPNSYKVAGPEYFHSLESRSIKF